MMKASVLIFIICFTFISGGVSQPTIHVISEDIAACTLHPHPRLVLTDQRLDDLKRQAQTDTVLQRYVRQVLKRADGLEKLPPLTTRASRECIGRVLTMGFAWRWTGEGKYAQASKENMLGMCRLMDWNPHVFLEVSELTLALSFGYDWLYSWLDAPSRDSIRYNIIRNGLTPGLAAYAGAPFGWWKDESHNWNAVCNNGIMIGALAIAERNRSNVIIYAYAAIPKAIDHLNLALAQYAPDGVWPEGTMYWAYTTNYNAYGMACIQTALGTDFGLSGFPGLSQTADFPVYCAGPTGKWMNFADSSEKSGPQSVFFWLGEKYNNQQYIDIQHNWLKRKKAYVWDVLWYQPPSEKPIVHDLDKYFRGQCEVAVFRSAWNDPEATFIGIKGGFNQVNHGHLDLGNIYVDAMGVRWVKDLGSDDYNLPGNWDHREGGRRFTYYRNMSSSHNVPMINGHQQAVEGKARMVKTSLNTTEPFAVIDLTEAYRQDTERMWRGVKMVDNRNAVFIRDEYRLPDKSVVEWAIMTDAEIKLKGRIAELMLDGKKMLAMISEPAQAVFSVESAEQAPPQEKNAGVKRLVVRLEEVSGEQAISVLLSPSGSQNVIKKYRSKGLSEW
jgi:hypothetical protein